MSVIIKHEAIEPFYLKHDYHGFSLFDSRVKSGANIMRSPEAGKLLQEVVKIKISELEGEFNFEEFDARCMEIHKAVFSSVEKVQVEDPSNNSNVVQR